MDLRELRYFAMVCSERNFTKAANRLHISQPSLSVALQKLENELGLNLLVRDNKHVVLTREGAILQREAGALLQQAERLEQQMADLRAGEQRTLKLAFPATVGACLWPVLLQDFRKLHPEIALQIEDKSTYAILHAVLEDALEIGYGVLEESTHDDIVSKPVRAGELRLLAAKRDALMQQEQVSLQDLAGRRVIMYRKGDSFAESRLLSEVKQRGIAVELQYVEEQATVFNLVAQGLGVAVILAETDLIRQSSALESKPFREQLKYKAGFFWKRDRYLSQSARLLMDFVLHKA